MSLKFGLFAALLLAASAAAAQPPAAGPASPQPAPPAGPQAAIQQAGMAFGQCISAAIQSVPASLTPEAGAASVMAGCATQRGELDRSVDAMIATIPETERATAHAQYQSQIGQAETQIADAIRQRRVAPPAPATPATPPH
jgi:hypothetical protein